MRCPVGFITTRNAHSLSLFGKDSVSNCEIDFRNTTACTVFGRFLVATCAEDSPRGHRESTVKRGKTRI
jgi:hypothetical protein